MEKQPPHPTEDYAPGETPEDVAALYAWANVPGAKYREFSANRQEYRAQMRERVAEQSRLTELRPQPAAGSGDIKVASLKAEVVTRIPESQSRSEGVTEAVAVSPLEISSESASRAAGRANPVPQTAGPVPQTKDRPINANPAIPELRSTWPTQTLGLTPPPMKREEPPPHSPFRGAERWSSLRNLFARPQEQQLPADRRGNTSILAVFSLAGGAGKTSLVATLGRSLSSIGEKVLLAETSPHGMLPYYFGASEGRAGTVRTFLPPGGCNAAPIHLVSYNVSSDRPSFKGDGRVEDGETQTKIAHDILSNSRWVDRVLIDLDTTCGGLAGRLAGMQPADAAKTVLVPLAPDMNSVVSVDAVEKMFGSVQDAEGKPLRPMYLLNQFDVSLPFHAEVREVLRQRIGERLLPFVIRRDPAIGEALAEGMTITDYGAGGSAAQDYAGVANWLRATTAPAAAGLPCLRWAEG